MRGWWKPLLAYGLLPVVVLAALAWRDGPLAPWLYVAIGAGVAPIVFLASYLAVPRVGRFLKGLRDAGEVVEVLEDRLDWFGERVVVLRGTRGTWRVEGTSGKGSSVRAQGPGDDGLWLVEGDERKRAREAAARVQSGGVAEPPPKELTLGGFLAGLGVLAGSLAVIGGVLGGRRVAFALAAGMLAFGLWALWKLRRMGRFSAR